MRVLALLAMSVAVLSIPACRASDGARATSASMSSSACRPARASSRFELGVLGSGGPRGFGRAASSYVVFVDGVARVLVDAGPGAFVRLGEMGVDFRRLDVVLLTHLHVDHSADLPGFVKSRDLTYQESLTFRIFGPSGGGDYPSTRTFVDRLFGPQGAFAYLPKFRNELRLDVTDLPIAQDAPISEVLREDDLRVTSISVDHGDVPAVAYRVEHLGHAIVFSGDLASKNDNLARLAEGADVLVYDTAVRDPPRAPKQLYDLHTAPHRIGEIAARARVKSLILSHVAPDVETSGDEVLDSVRASYGGPTRFATDCLRVDASK